MINSFLYRNTGIRESPNTLKTKFDYEKLCQNLEFLEILWISIQVEKTNSRKSDVEFPYETVKEKASFVDFLGNLVKFKSINERTGGEMQTTQVLFSCENRTGPLQKRKWEHVDTEHVNPSLYGFSLPEILFGIVMCRHISGFDQNISYSN